jgi:hypothetical protein
MDESTLELVRDWLMRANHDLRSARALAALDEPLLWTSRCSTRPFTTASRLRKSP